MKAKHKLLNDFQYISPDKKIFILKAGTILEEYNHKIKNEIIPIDKEIVDNNPEFFQVLDWKSELLTFMRLNKLPQPAQLGKKLIPFIEEMVLSSVEPKPVLDNSKIIEVESRETEIFKREQEIERKRLEVEQKLDEQEMRENRLKKRESAYKEDIEQLEVKEITLKEKSRQLIEKEFEIEDIKRSIEEKERGLELNFLKNGKEIEEKYKEIQNKLEAENTRLTKRDQELDELSKELELRQAEVEYAEKELKDKLRDLEQEKSIVNDTMEELKKINNEISEWENTHWKFRRNMIPPSAIPESKNSNI